jgi:3-dehydroquinate dehydratase-2
MKILLVNGPNLNLLGTREPAKYGRTTLPEVEAMFREAARELGVEAECFQSNHEGAIVDRLHAARSEGVAGVVVNAGAYTHTSVAIRDAFAGTAIPFVEIHVTNVHAREPFRHHSTLSDIAAGIVVGFGVEGYVLALRGLVKKLQTA